MKGRIVDAEQAVAAIVPGDRVFVSVGGDPRAVIEALAARGGELAGTKLMSGLSLGSYAFVEGDSLDCFDYTTWQVPADVSRRVRDAVEFVPLCFSHIPGLFLPDGRFPLDVGVVCLSPPDDDGMMSFGVSSGHAVAVVRNARMVIAEVNRRMPRTTGADRVHVSDVDYIVEVDRPLVELSMRTLSAAARQVGSNVAALVPDGATLELGLGAVPDAVHAALIGHNDLGLHTGMVTDGVIPLIESGVVNNRRKAVDRGKTVTGEVLGSRRIFDYVHENPDIEMHPVGYTHDPRVMAGLDNFCAINSAVEVDLGGQINSETVDGVFIGCGGQVDFSLGAMLSPGGRSIVAMTSTDSKGISRIVACLDRGVPVTLPRMLSHWVVTEYGVADLRGAGLKERAEALIAIAHPDHREALRDELGSR
jgi:4-hydroxybutyrate CoA-transferase